MPVFFAEENLPQRFWSSDILTSSKTRATGARTWAGFWSSGILASSKALVRTIKAVAAVSRDGRKFPEGVARA